MTRHLLPLVLIVALPASALADAKTEAKEHIAKATALHSDGRFAEALDELNTAYTLDPQPDLLYAIGQLNVKLGNCDQAVLFYKRYLKTKPEKRAAAATKEAIKTCKNHPPPAAPEPPTTVTTDTHDTEPAPPDTHDTEPAPPPDTHDAEPPPPVIDDTPPLPPSGGITGPIDNGPERHRGWYTDVVADVLLGGGLVAGGVGAYFYTSARSDLDAADDASDYDEHKDLVDKAHNKRLIAVGLAGAGVALVGAGIIRLMVHDRTEHRRVGVAPTHGGGVLVLEGSF
jgi:tetratricopeptide (TPR) repeat protein